MATTIQRRKEPSPCPQSRTSTRKEDPEVLKKNVLHRPSTRLINTRNPFLFSKDHRPPIYSSEEDASDIEDRKAKKLERAKALRDSDEEDDEDGGATSSKARDNSDSDDESD